MMRHDFSEEIDEIYRKLIVLEQQRDDIVRAKKLSYSESFQDEKIKEMECDRENLLEKVRKLQHVQVIQNSFLFASDHEYWVERLMKELDN